MNTIAPAVLFVYKRLECLKSTIKALQDNYLASQTDLIIYSDAHKNESDKGRVEAVRSYLYTIGGFKSITIRRSSVNKGLAKSIRSGITEVLRQYDSVIVLEDDLVTSRNFLDYMNRALQFYQENRRVFSISGYSFPISAPLKYSFDVYFNRRAGSWGWATWRDRWQVVNWNLLDDDKVKLRNTRALGSDFRSLIRKYRAAIIDSWAVPWSYYSFVNDMVTVYPIRSKVRNIGNGAEATHTHNAEERYETELDNGESTFFSFAEVIELNRYYTKRFAKKFSYYERIKWKVLNHWMKIVKPDLLESAK